MPETIQRPYLEVLSPNQDGIDYVGTRKTAGRGIRLAVVVEVDLLEDILPRAEASLRHIEEH